MVVCIAGGSSTSEPNNHRLSRHFRLLRQSQSRRGGKLAEFRPEAEFSGAELVILFAGMMTRWFKSAGSSAECEESMSDPPFYAPEPPFQTAEGDGRRTAVAPMVSGPAQRPQNARLDKSIASAPTPTSSSTHELTTTPNAQTKACAARARPGACCRLPVAEDVIVISALRRE